MSEATTTLINMYRRELDALANVWMGWGAQTVQLLEDGAIVETWGDTSSGSPVAQPCHQVNIMPRPNLDLRVVGRGLPADSHWLELDAQLLRRVFQVETDLDDLTEELVHVQDQLLAVMDLNRSTRAFLSVNPTLQVITEEVVSILRASSGFTVCHLPGQDPIMVEVGNRPEVASIGMSLFTEMQQTGRHVLRTPDETPTTLNGALMVPIYTRGEIVAGLGCFDAPGGFTSPQIKLAQAVAELAGERLESILLYQENLSNARMQTEMDLAWNVQASLIPHELPDVDGLELYATYKPALNVGGDFYDFMPQTDGALLFWLGDVSGKGMSAAMVMTMLHTSLRSIARRHQEPSEIVSTASEELYDDFTQINVFSTLFVGRYEPHIGTVHYANSGHSPVILCTAKGETSILKPDGVPIGVLPYSPCADHQITLNEGDVLVSATDGFNEAENTEGDFLGYNALCDLICNNRERAAEGIAHALLNAVETFSMGTATQSDDQSIIVMKRI